MPNPSRLVLRLRILRRLGFYIFAAVLPFAGAAQPGKKVNPASKIYVSDVSGEALIQTGETIHDLSKRSLYPAQGAVIETRKPASASDRAKHFTTMVYSNGTGAFFDADTRVELRRFEQEPFTPSRTDIDVEPSISRTQSFVSRGVVGLCTSKLVAGSSMSYLTPHGSVNIRGRKLVIEARDDFTKVSMIEGDCTVRGGPSDLGGHTVQEGEQAIIRRAGANEPSTIEVIRIPTGEMTQLEEKVGMACLAKRTVYFETREASTEGGSAVNAFDGAGNTGPRTEIVPIEIVPGTLPVQFTVSPATILSPGQTFAPGAP